MAGEKQGLLRVRRLGLPVRLLGQTYLLAQEYLRVANSLDVSQIIEERRKAAQVIFIHLLIYTVDLPISEIQATL